MEIAMRKRLEELRVELARGQETLADLERRSGALRAQMLRISGAVQVLEELLGQGRAAGEAADAA